MILQAGTMLQDRYEILEKIGSGGMSDVYKAKCHKLNRLVAIKVLKEEFTSDATFVSKFKMEGQAAAGLSHPNIVNIYDVVDEGELHFIVMELVEGITLKNYITKKGHLDVKEAIGIAIQVAQGIEAAHEQHIIHRDIKPQNMLISMDGKVKVADFGIARAVSSQTMNATVVGTVHYISPEQARGGYSDERSDIYSFGITLFEMVTGRVPFEGDNTVTVALAHLEDPLPLPSSYNPDVFPSFERIILKCTEKKPENRYANAGQVISDLRRALLDPDDEEIGKRPDSPLSSTRPITQKELEIIQERSQKPKTERDRGEIDVINLDRRGPESRDTGRRDAGRQDAGHGQGGHKNRDEATQIEKIFTILGLIAAIVVVVAAIVFFTRLGGAFNGTSEPETTAAASETGETDSEETEDDSGEEEATLSQREVRMPLLVGDTLEAAEEKLNGADLRIRVQMEESEDVPENVVIAQEIEAGSVISRYSVVNVTVSSGSNQVDLSSQNLTEMTLDNAVRLLEGLGLHTTVVEEASETEEAGNIIRFEPADRAPAGSTVTLYVSTGPAVQTVAVPPLEGQPGDAVVGLLDAVGLVNGQVDEEYSSTVPEGHVISQGIGAGEQVEPGTAVDYTLSLGPKPAEKQFIGSLQESYPLMVSYGPGAGSSEIQIILRLKQNVNGQDVYTRLTDIRSYSSDTILDIDFDRIRGADGVTTGEVEIVDLTNNVVLKSYNVTFQEVEVTE